MESQPVSPSPAPASGGNERMMSIASLVIGVINLCAWFFPICGFPLGIVGIVLGFLGMKDPSQKTLAIIGMVLSGLGLFAACINGALGAYMAVSGEGFQFAP
ncbi:MAG: hypothetical protein RIR73_555 [Chloroflexota bacterium]